MKKGFVLILVLAFICTFTSTAYASTAKRLAGETKYDTSASIVLDGWKQSDYALLAFGENYPDALSAVPLAKKYDAPILLTGGNSLPSATRETLISLQVKNVFIIGGTAVIPSTIDAELQGMKISVTRVAGHDRYDTAIKVAEQLSTPTEIMVVTGDDYPDALSVGPIAALKQEPIILVPKDYMPASVKAYLSKNKITKSYVVGNSNIISDNILSQFPGSIRIAAGVDKYDRNIKVNTEFDYVFNTNDICLTTGEGFADALAGAAYAAKRGLPIVLVNDNPPSYTRLFTVDKLNIDNNGVPYVFGGTTVVPDSVVTYLSTLPDTNQTNKPSAPTNLVATAISSSQITIQWDQMSDADYYHIYYILEEPNSFLYSFINSDGSKLQCKWYPESSAQLNDIEANTTVYFKITSVKDGIESDYSNVASAITLPASSIE